MISFFILFSFRRLFVHSSRAFFSFAIVYCITMHKICTAQIVYNPLALQMRNYWNKKNMNNFHNSDNNNDSTRQQYKFNQIEI